MSFGFSVGDFVTAGQLAKKVYDRLREAPSQIKDALTDVENISNHIRNGEAFVFQHVSDPQAKAETQKSVEACKTLLQDLQTDLNEYQDVISNGKGKRVKAKALVKRLGWSQTTNTERMDRISLNLNQFQMSIQQLVLQTSCRTEAGVERLHEREDQKDQDLRRQAILKWLCPSRMDYFDQQNALKKRRQRGVGEWFLETHEFKNWIHSGQDILLCSGMPGSGKTMITSFVVSRILDNFRKDSHIGIAYIYCQFSRKNEQTPTHLMSSILRQLADRHHDIPKRIRTLYNSTKGDEDLTPDEVTDLLNTVLQTFTKTFIIVDGLDELPNSTGARHGFVSRLAAMQKQFGIKIYAASRSATDGTWPAQNTIRYQIRARNADIKYRLESLFEDGSLLSDRPDLREQAISRILRLASGILLLAELCAKHIVGIQMPQDLSHALDKLASSSNPYAVVYDQAMQRIKGDDNGQQNLALTTLCWTFLARRPLHLPEVLDALAVEQGTSRLNTSYVPKVSKILEACAGLVVFNEASNSITLFHQTFWEYLSDKQPRWFPRGNEIMGRTCITYLSYDAFVDGPCAEVDPVSLWSKSASTDRTRLLRKRLQQYPLYEYASRYWSDHVRGTALETDKPTLCFLADNKKVSASLQTLQTIVPRTTGTHLAVRYSLHASLKRHLEHHRCEVNVKDNMGRSPLSYASEQNDQVAIELLIQSCADPDLEDDDNTPRLTPALTPLAYAALNSSVSTTRDLLQKGAAVNLQDCYGRNAMFHASEAGSEALVRLLLDHGSKLDLEDYKRRTPLSYAAEAGSTEVVSLLLERGARADSKNCNHETPLLFAARARSETLIALLLAKGASPHLTYTKHDTPLSCVVTAKLLGSCQLLLRAGADPDGTASPENPLHQATIEGPQELVRLLVKAGADVNRRGQRGAPPLAYAARNGWLDIMRLLLGRGAKADTFDSGGKFVLSYAAEGSSLDAVELLLEHGADINPSSSSITFCEPLYYALGMKVMTASDRRPANEPMLKLLLARGANPNEIGQNKRSRLESPLFYALKNLPSADPSTLRVAKLLLEHGAKTDWRDGKGNSIVSCAKHHEEAVKDLLRQYGAPL